MEEIIRARYPPSEWNIYGAQASDGDNWHHDSGRCRELLADKSCRCAATSPTCRWPRKSRTCGTSTPQLPAAHRALRDAQGRPRPTQIYPVFRDLFKKEGARKARMSAVTRSHATRWSRAAAAARPQRAAPQRAARRPATGRFELIEQYHAVIRDTAERFGLDTYPNQLEIITAEQMMDAYASVGMPVNYRHWSYGKEFIATEKNYKRGHMGLAYEIVINSNPCISYLMEENTMAMQALVIAHAAYGHNSFFKGNYLFRMWTDAASIIDYLVYAKNYVADCEERHGLDAVESLLDSCHALMNHGVDRYRRPSRKTPGAGTGRAQGPRGLRAAAGQRPVAHAAAQAPRRPTRQPRPSASPTSRRRTCCTSSRRTRRCWSPGSARSCASCARWRSTSTRSARPR